ncbi:hypothetical protein [Flavobacterium sp. I3-2]|uniref:hypothetical protein n=1 Tax=Flavobacterium sp. I3-2 TaxID=2748319 RepID=UPI0015A94ABA|nr:hypothetical protein [Flavobacterium sp. I3-2]
MVDKFQYILKDFDSLIDQYILQIEEEISNVDFDSTASFEFKLNNEFDSSIFKGKDKIRGLYFFEVDLDSTILKGQKRITKLNRLIQDWGKKKNDSFFSSSVIKGKVKHYDAFDKRWLPLYIGKNKDVYKRIIDHIELKSTSQTYAMKLRHRKNLNDINFRVSILNIDIVNYDFIVPHIERTLREKYKPIVGKQ